MPARSYDAWTVSVYLEIERTFRMIVTVFFSVSSYNKGLFFVSFGCLCFMYVKIDVRVGIDYPQ